MSIHKIVVKGTGKMSLHERFTQLRFDQKATSVTAKAAGATRSSYVSDYSAPSYSPPRARLVPHYPPPPRAASPVRYSSAVAARRPVASYAVVRSEPVNPWSARSYSIAAAATRVARPAVRSSVMVGRSQQPGSSSLGVMKRVPSQSASMIAAAKLKKKSIHQRLGVRPAVPTWQESRLYRSASTGSLARWGSSGNLSRWSSQGYLSRWSSNGSLNSTSGYGGYRPRWGGYNRRGRSSWGGGYWGRRQQSENNGFDRGGRWRFGGGGGGGRYNRWGRRGRGGGWRGGNQRRQPPPSREELDKELDAYMAGTRGVLDKEMDDYMSAKNA